MHSIDTGYINLRFFSLSPNHPEVQTTSTILLLFYRLRTYLPVCLNCLLACLLVQSPILNSVTSQSQKNITADPANQTLFPGSQNAKYVSFKTRAGQGKAGQQQRRWKKNTSMTRMRMTYITSPGPCAALRWGSYQCFFGRLKSGRVIFCEGER